MEVPISKGKIPLVDPIIIEVSRSKKQAKHDLSLILKYKALVLKGYRLVALNKKFQLNATLLKVNELPQSQT